MPSLINRPEYLTQLIQNRDVDLVKIVTGIRRCGKSSLLDLFHQYLSADHVPDTHIIHMNLESLRYRNLTDYLAFYDYVSARIPAEGKTYLIFDELQVIEHWEKAVESFRLDFDVDIYITGSNAMLLSAEFSTLLSGRYVEIRMLPLSFREFLTFYEFGAAVTMEEKFLKYLQFGGMPILREYHFDEARSNQALEGIYSTVVLRDILQRNNQADQNTLQKIVLFSARISEASLLQTVWETCCLRRERSGGLKAEMSRGKPSTGTFPCFAAHLSFILSGDMM